jgi:hypothetical protein
MARPVTRTERLEVGELEALKKQFGSATFAYRELDLLHRGLNYPTFYLAWRGREVTPKDRDLIIDGFAEWGVRAIQALREREKDAEQEVA